RHRAVGAGVAREPARPGGCTSPRMTLVPRDPAPRRSPDMRRMITRLIALTTFSVTLTGAAAAAPDDAKLQFDRGYLRRAAAACERRLAANARDAEAGALLSRIRSEQGDVDQALKLASAAVTADPKNADAQYALSEYYGRKARDAGMLSAAGLAGKM